MNTCRIIIPAIFLALMCTGCVPEITVVSPEADATIIMNPGDGQSFEITVDPGNFSINNLSVGWEIINDATSEIEEGTDTDDAPMGTEENGELKLLADFYPDQNDAGCYTATYRIQYGLRMGTFSSLFIPMGSISQSWKVVVQGIAVLPEIPAIAEDQEFTATAYPEGDYAYQWFLDGQGVSTEKTYTFRRASTTHGPHTLSVTAVGEGGTFNSTRQIIVPFATVLDVDSDYSMRTIDKTSDGGYILAGSSDSIEITRFDNQGNVSWSKTLDESGFSRALSVRETTDGGYIVAGWSEATDISGAPNAGAKDAYVAKLDSAGTIEWQKLFGGANNDEAWDILPTADGGYILTGPTGYVGSYNVDTSPDCWVIKLNSVGNVTWQDTYGGSGCDWGMRIFADADGGYLMAGVSNSRDILGDAIQDAKNGYLVKIASDGALIWQKRFGDSTIPYVDLTTTGHRYADFTAALDGGYLCAASFFDETSYTWLVGTLQLNTDGEELWRNTSSDIMGTSVMAISTLDGYIITSASGRYAYATTVDSLGNKLGVLTFGDVYINASIMGIVDAGNDYSMLILNLNGVLENAALGHNIYLLPIAPEG
jgi:hypothetical protein